MYLIIISILVILTGIYIIFNKELFTNKNDNKEKTSSKERALVTMHSITKDEKEYVKFLIQFHKQYYFLLFLIV